MITNGERCGAVYFNQATTNLQGADYRHGSLLATFGARRLLMTGGAAARLALFLPVMRRVLVNSKIYYIVKSGGARARRPAHDYDYDSRREETKTRDRWLREKIRRIFANAFLLCLPDAEY